MSNQSAYAGRLQFFKNSWKKVTCNNTVLSWIKGFKIQFHKKPPYTTGSYKKCLSATEIAHMDVAIKELLTLGAVTRCSACTDQVVSPVFLADKPNGEKRFILNLK